MLENARVKRELAEQKEEAAIKKKGYGALRQGNAAKCTFIEQDVREFQIFTMAEILKFSRSVHYSWSPTASRRAERQCVRKKFDTAAVQAFERGKCCSGLPRLLRDLRDAGIPCNRKAVAKGSRIQRLIAKASRMLKATSNSDHEYPVAPNLLGEDFSATNPD